MLNEDGHPIEGFHSVRQNGHGGQILWDRSVHISRAVTSGRLVEKVLSQPSMPVPSLSSGILSSSLFP